MPNPIIVQIKMPSGNIYDIVDQGARDLIQELLNFTKYLGVTTSNITEGSTINPIMIDGEEVTAVAGNVVTLSSDSTEWIFSSTGKWQNFGKLSGLGALAFKDNASGSYTPAGSVSASFSGESMSSSGVFTPQGNVSSNGGTKTIKQFKTAGSLTGFAVSNGILEITDGVLPTGEDVTVGDGTVTSSFEGTQGNVSVSGTPAGSVSGSFSGTPATITVS